MQAQSGQHVSETNSQLRKLTTYVILGFAFTGLLSGFIFGGLLHFGSNTTNGNTGTAQKSTPGTQTTRHVTVTPTVQPVVELDPPKTLNLSSASLIADGTTVYNVKIQTVAKSHDTAIHASDITCKAWLVQSIPNPQILNIDPNILKNVSDLKATIPGTVNNQPYPEMSGLTFAASTPQIGFCQPDGTMNWNFTVAQGTPAGNYDIVLLTDWRGVHWNWSWDNITIQVS